MGYQNKKMGKKSGNFDKYQIEIIKFFRDIGINILKHRKINGIIVEIDDSIEISPNGEELDNKFVIGIISTNLKKLSRDKIIEDNGNGLAYEVVDDIVFSVDGNFTFEALAEHENLLDENGILEYVQEAVNEGICELSEEFDIVVVKQIEIAEFEDISNDINDRW